MAETERQRALKAVQAGDVIFGVGAGGQPKLMIVRKADDFRIWTRHVTTGVEVEFGRDGKSLRVPDGGSCEIISTAPLPAKWHKVAVGLDHKMNFAEESADHRLSKDEIELLLWKDDFFKSRALPET